MTDVQDLALHYALNTERGRQDPYPALSVVRDSGGIFKSASGTHVVARFDHCQEVLRSRAFGHRTARLSTEPGSLSSDELALSRRYPRIVNAVPSLLELNPPEHTRLRTLVSSAFSPRLIHGMHREVGDVIQDVVGGLGDSFDAVSSLAERLPIRVIGQILGIDRQTQAALLPHIAVIIASTDRIHPRAASVDRLYSSIEAVEDSILRLIKEKAEEPMDDLLSALVRTVVDGEKLSNSELLALVRLLFVAGFESSIGLIGNGIRALLSTPGAAKLLRNNGELIDGAVLEMLRYDAPVQLVGRHALQNTEVDGHQIAAGDQVLVLIGAANRDPRAFVDPDRFHVLRDEGMSLSFAAGIHYCVGAPLIQLEMRLLLEALFAKYEHLELGTDEITYRPGLVLRGVQHLHVRGRLVRQTSGH